MCILGLIIQIMALCTLLWIRRSMACKHPAMADTQKLRDSLMKEIDTHYHQISGRVANLETQVSDIRNLFISTRILIDQIVKLNEKNQSNQKFD